MKKIVVLTGAGVSAESGIPTFRDAGGLWEGYKIEDVASPIGWNRDFKMVLNFYNLRRAGIRNVEPNEAHIHLAKLEGKYQVTIITQNIDDLHERGGSSEVIHLHGEIFKARSTKDSNLIYNLGDADIFPGDLCEKGSQLRPHIVWFGEEVPMISKAIPIVSDADIIMVVGTSMLVYPAAGLLNYAPMNVPIYFVDPNIPDHLPKRNLICIADKASIAVPMLVKKLMEN